MAVKEVAVADWDDFIKRANTLQHHRDRLYMFRGVSQRHYLLKPGLLRRFENIMMPVDAWTALVIEGRALDMFANQAPLHLPAGTLAAISHTFREDRGPHLIQWWTLMQHYGAATRLLDWTDSAYVAAYFAVERDRRIDGAVWALDVKALNRQIKRVYGLNFPRPEDNERRFRETRSAEVVWPIQPIFPTDRMVAQQGRFTIAEQVLTDHGAALERLADGDDEMFFPMVISAGDKRRFLRGLRRMNIGGAALFPGLDGLGRSVAENSELGLGDTL